MKRQIAKFIAGATALASLPAGFGVYDWRLLLGAAVVGGVGGLCGVNVARNVKTLLDRRKK